MSTAPASILYAFVTLLAMVNPVEAAAAFSTLTAGRTPLAQSAIALRASIAGCAILLAFGYGGEALLKALGVSLQAFKIAGGLLLLKVAFDMVFAEKTARKTADSAKASVAGSDPSIFPLAIPIISGPGALTAAVTLINRAHEEQMLTDVTFLAIAVAVFVLTYLAMRGAERLTRILGPEGVDATGRLVGIIVAAISVQLILDGFTEVARGFRALMP